MTVLRVGITGPHEGLTSEQKRYVDVTTFAFLTAPGRRVDEFWSGCAYEVDTIGVRVARRAGVPVVGLTVPRILDKEQLQTPGQRPRILRCNHALIREARDGLPSGRWRIRLAQPGRTAADGYLNRDDLTVASIDELLAFPPTCRESVRSGTWATIRRMRKILDKRGGVIHCYPLDGSGEWTETSAQESLL